MKTILTKDILFNYFSGNASALQKTLIRDWLTEESHVELYYEWLMEWEKGHPQFLPDPAHSFQKNLNRIQGFYQGYEHSSHEVNTEPMRQNYGIRFWLRLAGCLLLVGLGVYSQRQNIFYEQYQTTYGQLGSFTLTDGSTVILNANSNLLVSRWQFWSGQRNVHLSGEAEFTVKHTKDNKQFIVHTPDDNRVVVLGTKFLVYTRPKGTRVVLNQGKVQFNPAGGGRHMSMQPGEKVIVDGAGKLKLVKLSPAELANESAWKEQRFVFEHTSLREVALKMQEVFGIRVQISDSVLASRELTGSFKAQNANELFLALSELLEMGIIHSENQILLTPEP